MPSPGWTRFTKLASKRLILRAIRELGDGDKERTREIIGGVQYETMRFWIMGRVAMGPGYRKRILSLLKQRS